MTCLWQNSSEAIITMQMERYTFLFYGLPPKLSARGGKSKTTSLGKQRGITEVNVAVPELSNEGCHQKLTGSHVNSTMSDVVLSIK